ncbi:hypothetical protein D779_0175 [Imhoffiella purpurea]|uniref:Uncharacterized protein n=1 Tax=Imhoffiella purpurea TaxID=1249627 RepID=W9VA24_9GAMM|nr:hypothetical protein D779_0175 [Imhoffiella purpurea]
MSREDRHARSEMSKKSEKCCKKYREQKACKKCPRRKAKGD